MLRCSMDETATPFIGAGIAEPALAKAATRRCAKVVGFRVSSPEDRVARPRRAVREEVSNSQMRARVYCIRAILRSGAMTRGILNSTSGDVCSFLLLSWRT